MNTIIPIESRVYEALSKLAHDSKIIVLCGLPGVGKSLYTLALNEIITQQKKRLDIIQWDVARKAFETPEILAKFPLGDGLVHNGVKLAAGHWLINTVDNWIKDNGANSTHVLLIEAPLIGHRFIELAKVQKVAGLESFLSSPQVKFICPIPSKEVRSKITQARMDQVKDDATIWIGAKPKIVQALWENLFELAGQMGFNIKDLNKSIYDPEIYDYVYRNVLKHRNYLALTANEIFDLPIKNESELHQLKNHIPSTVLAAEACDHILEQYPTDAAIDHIIHDWYLH